MTADNIRELMEQRDAALCAFAQAFTIVTGRVLDSYDYEKALEEMRRARLAWMLLARRSNLGKGKE